MGRLLHLTRYVWLVACLLATGAAAQSVRAIYPLSPLRTGAEAADIAFEVDAATSQVTVAVEGASATGPFVHLSDLVLQRDRGSAVPFHLRIPLATPYPADGVLKVTATPSNAVGSGAAGIVAFNPSSSITLTAEPTVTTSGGAIVVTVPLTGELAFGELNLTGTSGQSLRAVHGSLKEAAGSAFASTTGLRTHLNLTASTVTWTVPTSADIPFDGVVVADLVLEDAFGRRVHRSVVEMASEALDSITALRVQPSTILMKGGFGTRLTLGVVATFLLAGEVDVSGAGHGVRYSSSDDAVAIASADGTLVARQNGTAVITVEYGGISQNVQVVVDSTATLASVSIAPTSPVVEAVGTETRVTLAGLLTSGTVVDLTTASTGTRWAVDDQTVASVGPDGRVTGLRPGTTILRSENSGLSASVPLVVKDGLPTVTLSAPSSVVAGARFDVTANATDDVAVARVDFTVEGVPFGSLTTPRMSSASPRHPTPGGHCASARR